MVKEDFKKDTEESESEQAPDNEEDLEDINEEESIDEDKFVEFLQPSVESESPSLGQVAVAPELRATDLEQDLSNVVGLENNKKEEDPFKYSIGSNLGEEAKYVDSGSEIERTTTPSRVNMMELGKEPSILPSEIGFSESPSSQIGGSSDVEKYSLPGKFDVREAGKEDPFKKPEVKYEPSEEY